MARLTPLTRRRLANFRANRRGYWSLVIFLVLFGISLVSEVIANDKPIVMRHNGELWFPVLFSYTEHELGGEFLTEAKYEDPYVQGLIQDSGGWMVWPLIRFSYDTIDWFTEEGAPAPPSARHWLGTDDGARDVAARLLYGFRLSVSFGLALTAVASVIGIAVGAVQGYFGGNVDLIGQRMIEIWGRPAGPVPAHHPVEHGGTGAARAAWPASPLQLDDPGLGGPRGVPARAELRLRARGTLARGQQRDDHAPTRAAQRDGGNAHVPAVHPERFHHHLDGVGLPRLRPPGGLGLPRRTARPGQGEHPDALARTDRIRHARRDADAAHFRRRGGQGTHSIRGVGKVP